MDHDGQITADTGRRNLAHIAPLALFMVLQFLGQLFGRFFGWDHPLAPWWQRHPEQWIYPLQVLVCLPLLVRWWRIYEFRWTPGAVAAGVVFGALGIGLWLLPTTLYDHLGMRGESSGLARWLGLAPRTDGFDPGVFEHQAAYWTSLLMRFMRAAVVVALVEEIFWRGFLMRFLLDWDGDYWRQPFGKPSWLSFAVVTGLFVLAHQPLDYAGALVYGSLTYLLCVWSRSLSACVVMHATANFLMGCYVMAYGKYGLW
jgi:CAAX prenyl protease-like protein